MGELFNGQAGEVAVGSCLSLEVEEDPRRAMAAAYPGVIHVLGKTGICRVGLGRVSKAPRRVETP